MKVLKKVLIILMVALICMSCVAITSQATDWKNVDQFDSHNDSGLDDTTRDIVGAIVSVVRIVGTGVAIIMLAFVAIKYMSSAPGDRAEIKKHAVVYVVGAIVLFATSGILGIIQDFAGNID